MIVAVALLAMAGASPSQQPAVRAGMMPRVAPVVRVRRPEIPSRVMQVIKPELHEAVVCAAHMELLMEKLSARGEDAGAPVILIEEYWQALLPDPDSAEAIPSDTFVSIKDTLDASALETPSVYLQGLQECVVSAARGGALQ